MYTLIQMLFDVRLSVRCHQAYTEMQGRVHLRRYSDFYLNFVIIPNIFITMIGFAAHSFRGHTAGSVTFIAGTGSTPQALMSLSYAQTLFRSIC